MQIKTYVFNESGIKDHSSSLHHVHPSLEIIDKKMNKKC
jgi:hypothetical protein